MKEKYLYAPILVLSFLLAGSQPALGTKFIPSDTLIGTWDPVTRTYTLTTDVSETIQIDEDNLTLDGVGHTVTGLGTVNGIYLYERTGVILKNLNVQEFKKGICLDSSRGNTLTGNNVNSNNLYGIYLWASSGNTLTGNNANSNYFYGIYISWYSDDNTLTGNTVSNNKDYGIKLYKSSDNQIYNNNFIDNSTQAHVAGGSGNVFNLDKPVGGNYWSDWTSLDNDGDGFVDYPYVFTGGQDNLPWASLNQPPVADAGPDQTVEQESYEGTEVTLDGSGSMDLDSTEGTNDGIVSFGWYEEGTLLGSGEIMNYTFPLGSHTITLVVTDRFGETDEDEVIIVVQDTTSPEVVCELVPIEAEEDEGLFEVQFSAADICDRNPSVEAVMVCDGVELRLVSNDEWVIIELDEECEVEYEDGILEIKGPNPHLQVTATDESGNVGECIADPSFATDEDGDGD